MNIEDTYTETRYVVCRGCHEPDEIELDLVAYVTTEIGEWVCAKCGYMNDYINETVWDRVDEYVDQMKEERAWQEQ